MTKTKKVMIGVVSMLVLIPLFWGVHYFYVIYNTEELDVYVENCRVIQGNDYVNKGKCLNDFYQKCKSTGGEPVDLVKCTPPPPGAFCFGISTSKRCCFTETICKCSFGKGWDNQEGCKFL